MTMKAKYVNEMNRILASSELKRALLDTVGTVGKRGIYRRAAMVFACFILLLAIVAGGSLLQQSEQAAPSMPVDGFVVTAYTSGGEPVAVRPHVSFPLGQYAPTMSSVPGFPITLAVKQADTIAIRVTTGQLIRWDTETFKVQAVGQQTSVQSGDTIYWSPISEGDQPKTESRAIVTLSAIKDGETVGTRTIEITSDERLYYRGILQG